MNPAATGALTGLVLGIGAASIATAALSGSRTPLELRVLPYLRDVPLETVPWTVRPPAGRAAAAFLHPALERAAARLGRLLGGHQAIQRKLDRASSPLTVHAFRASQVAWGLGAFGMMLLIGLVGPARGPDRALTWLLACGCAALLGVMARDLRLSQAVKRREARVLTEFPVIADLLALSVAAGEGPVGALERVVATCRGALPDDLARILAETRSGTPVAHALDRFAARTGLPVVARFAEGLAVALERGTPLADVLTAQAADVREASRRTLIEAGARKEIAMMVPVVFLIMPVTLLFAFYPGVVGLRLLAP